MRIAEADRETFARDGAVLLPGLFDPAAIAALADLPIGGPGRRLRDSRLPAMITPAIDAAGELLGARAFPVRAVLFDKSARSNWAVPWHQDRTVPVAERIEVAGFGPWSRKDGAPHVAPPMSVLAGMATLRIHIDPVDEDNAPLRAALGSHGRGLIPADKAAECAAQAKQVVCLAKSGDVWAYATAILHASDRAALPRRRRVLQVDFATSPLPGGLRWAGVV